MNDTPWIDQTKPMTAPVHLWSNHATALPPDPYSGAAITRIRPGGVFYCEEPRNSPDGKRVLFVGYDAERKEVTYNVLDLDTMRDAVVANYGPLLFGCGYSRFVYLWQAPVGGRPQEIDRVDLTDLTIEPVLAAVSDGRSQVCRVPSQGRPVGSRLRRL
jgi:hypothetical protein